MKTSRSLVAAVAVLLPLAVACSNSKDIAETPSTSGSTTTAVTSPASPTPTDPTPTSPTTPSISVTTPPAAEGSRLQGDGYSVTVPGGWEDITASLKATNPQLDVAMGQKGATGFRTNFNVVHSSSHPGTIADNGAAIRQEAAAELKSITKKPVLRLPDRSVDGETAIGQTSTFTSSGTSVTFVQYFAVHDTRAFPITMTFATANKTAAVGTLDRILSTWQWDR